MRAILVVEGVTGAGKSRLIAAFQEAALQAAPRQKVVVIDEARTLGAIMDDVRTPSWREAPSFPALDACLAEVRLVDKEGDTIVIIERFHLTAFALYPDWEAVRVYDAALNALGAWQVLLSYPPDQIAERSLDRADRLGEDWSAEMTAYYGSRRAAVEAIRDSQARRIEAMALSQLRHLHFDTSEQSWEVYAARVIERLGLRST